MDPVLVPAIFWEEPVPHRLYAPSIGDILITLDADNFAETSFWRGSMPTSNTAIRGAWIVAVESIPSSEVGPSCLNPAWTEAGFCVLSVYKAVDGVSWRSIDRIPMRISSLLAPHGLGRRDATKPSEENVLVVLHTNNIPLTTPLLEAAWWRPCYESRSISNSWVLGIVDLPGSNAETVTRIVSCWVCGPDRIWFRDGMPQSVTMPIQRNSGNRIEFEAILESVRGNGNTSHDPASAAVSPTSTPPSSATDTA